MENDQNHNEPNHVAADQQNDFYNRLSSKDILALSSDSIPSLILVRDLSDF